MDSRLHASARLNRETVAEAARWFIEFRAGDVDAGTRSRFIEWLRRSPDNIQGYLEVAASWADLPTQDPHNKIDIGSLLARAKAEENVAPLQPNSGVRTFPDEEPSIAAPARRLRWAIAATVLGVAVAIGWWTLPSGQTYTTRVGEQRMIELADGSTVELNVRSRLRVHLTAREREVELIDGEALFHVAKDHNRPFIVSSGDTRVRAVGTQFDVYKQRDRTTVTVVEGKVAVWSAHSATANSVLVADQQLTVTPQATSQPKRTDTANATAWMQKRLVFEDTRLEEVAEQFNRYNTRELIIEGTALRDIRISGIYSSTDPGSLIGFLRNFPAIRVTETASSIRIQHKP